MSTFCWIRYVKKATETVQSFVQTAFTDLSRSYITYSTSSLIPSAKIKYSILEKHCQCYYLSCLYIFVFFLKHSMISANPGVIWCTGSMLWGGVKGRWGMSGVCLTRGPSTQLRSGVNYCKCFYSAT